MADVISLDSDEDESQKKSKAQQPTEASKAAVAPSKPPPVATAAPPSPQMLNKVRPGPLSAKLKHLQVTGSDGLSPTNSGKHASQVLSARATLAGVPSQTSAPPPPYPPQHHQARAVEPMESDSCGPVTRNQKKSELELAKLKDKNSRFLEDFDPETSIREKRKLNRKSYTEPKYTGKAMAGVIFDDKGVHRATGMDSMTPPRQWRF